MLPAAWKEWWREVLTAIRRTPWRTGGTDGAQGAAGPSGRGLPTGSASATPASAGTARPGSTDGSGSTASDTVDTTAADTAAHTAAGSGLWQTPVADLSYNQLVRDAMADAGRAQRMDDLDRHRTDDHVRMFTTKIVYCTGCILVLVAGLAGLLAVMGAFHMNNPWLMGTVTTVVLSPVVAVSRQLAKVISQAGADVPTLSNDRRAVVPAQRPEQSADDPS
ncbi:hypothetical protein [Streptomyces sp. R41]|uniref:DUF2335 domain-containing protein n=1 Tax=Streptomyces sp. R41 TaxID=3238632 RepID=A0AB39R953_9ACTN